MNKYTCELNALRRELFNDLRSGDMVRLKLKFIVINLLQTTEITWLVENKCLVLTSPIGDFFDQYYFNKTLEVLSED